MTGDMESVYWRTNPEWWNIVNNEYVLTDKATARARESFKIFKGEKLLHEYEHNVEPSVCC